MMLFLSLPLLLFRFPPLVSFFQHALSDREIDVSMRSISSQRSSEGNCALHQWPAKGFEAGWQLISVAPGGPIIALPHARTICAVFPISTHLDNFVAVLVS